MDYEIRLLDFNDGDTSLKKIVDLQNVVYEGKHSFSIRGFRQRYLNNPMGKVVSFNAFYKDEIVAHYACIPYKMKIDGQIVLGLLDIATVTHPDHRGKGLFKTLAQRTFQYAKENGFEFVLGVANANSFPGYMKHFPFTFVGQLDVRLGWGTNVIPNGEKQFSIYWDTDAFDWRLKCNRANYSREKDCAIGKYNSLVHTFMGKFEASFLDGTKLTCKGWGKRPKLFVGMGAKFNSLYLTVPKFIKRSPFNLIFLDLTEGMLPIPNKDNFYFQLFDLDVC